MITYKYMKMSIIVQILSKPLTKYQQYITQRPLINLLVTEPILIQPMLMIKLILVQLVHRWQHTDRLWLVTSMYRHVGVFPY